MVRDGEKLWLSCSVKFSKNHAIGTHSGLSPSMPRDLAADGSYSPALLDILAIPSRFRNCENMISIAAVEELSYRQSRLCRLLRNPRRLYRGLLAGQR